MYQHIGPHSLLSPQVWNMDFMGCSTGCSDILWTVSIFGTGRCQNLHRIFGTSIFCFDSMLHFEKKNTESPCQLLNLTLTLLGSYPLPWIWAAALQIACERLATRARKFIHINSFFNLIFTIILIFAENNQLDVVITFAKYYDCMKLSQWIFELFCERILFRVFWDVP